MRTQKVDKIGKSQKNVNQLAVLGSLHTGVGATHLEAIMATMEVPALSRRSFNDIEETVGEALETEATENCEKAAIEEISLSREQNLPGQSVSVDQGWQKRGVGMNSRSGHSSMIGELSKKVIDY